MKKNKVCVYTICKNEEQFVDRWFESMKEADEIYVLDTGSTDNTVEKLKQHGVHVKTEIIEPWRFDIARNLSLEMVPKDCDICVCTDLDEVLNTGWRTTLEKIWKKDTTRCKYIYNWKLDEYNKPLVSFYYEKIHSRKNYKWVFPVHEILEYTGKNEHWIKTDDIILNHYPDPYKSRGNYLKLLELSVKENPNNGRNRHYLGREYMFHEKWNDAIDTLIFHLKLPSSTWKDERAASMRFIARCYQQLNRIEEARMWLIYAIREAPYLRDAYVELAKLEYTQENWDLVSKYGKKALEIKVNERSYINEIFTFDETIYDLLSISSYYQNKIEDSLKYINKALEINPNNERIRNNKIYIEQELKQNNIITKNSIDKKFYDLISNLKRLTEEEIFNNIKYCYKKLNPDTKKSIEAFFSKFDYWGTLNHNKDDYEEIKRRANSIYNHLEDFIWFYKKLEDYRSKKLLYAILNNWYCYDFITLKKCQENTYKDYFDLDIVECDENEVFVDLGAFTGDTIIDFLNHYNGKYKRIYAYEVTEDSFKQLEQTLCNFPNIELRKKAVLDKKTSVFIEKNIAGASANKIMETGIESIEAVSLDIDIKEKITTIKMDIEGSEEKALIGATNHIKNEQPKLLLSVYHNHEDIWKIPKMIEEIQSGYQFYLRYHGGNIFPTEVTLIAIYKEK